jgi:hypothetical protein
MSYIFTTCYGEELDVIEERLTSIETQLTSIQEKINAGYIVESVTPLPASGTRGAGFRIRFIGPNGAEEHDIYSGIDGAPGAPGAPGTNGKDAPTWRIGANGMWEECVIGANGTTCTASIYPASDKSPEVKNGLWVFYVWHDETIDPPTPAGYDTIPSNLVADSLSTYIVDHGRYYDLFIPVQLTDANGELLFNEAGRPVTVTKILKLPKWIEEQDAPLFFKILGYAEIIGTDTFSLQDLRLEYHKIDSLYNHTDRYEVTKDSAIWRWRMRPEMPIEYSHIVPQLSNQRIAVVFSINKSKLFMESLVAEDLVLKDSREQRGLNFVGFNKPESLSGLLTTKGGNNGDTLYYARMVNNNNLQSLGLIQGQEKIFYRLVIQDSIKSDFAAHTIAMIPVKITPSNTIEVRANNLPLTPVAGPPDTFNVTRNVANRVSLSPSNRYYDYYIWTDTLNFPVDSVILSGNTGAENYKTFTVKADSIGYEFPLGIYKLQMDGAIYVDTIVIRAN